MFLIFELMALKEYGEAIAVVATFLFMIQMLTPLATFYKVVRTKTTGDISVAPYNTAFLSCSVWMLYGFIIRDTYVTQTNAYGAVLQLSYTLCFYSYCTAKVSVAKQITTSTLVFLVATTYCWIETDSTKLVQRFGLFCSLITLAFFAAPFSNLRHVLKERNAESLPFLLIAFTFVVSLLWMLYGFVIDDLALQMTNLVGVMLSSIQLFLIAWLRPVISMKGKPLLGVV